MNTRAGPRYAVFDLDNCLSDDRERIPLIDFSKTGEARWDRYHQVCGRDPAANVDVFKDALRLGLTPVFITMRPEQHRLQTVSWIAHHLNIGNPCIFMRKDGDRTPSVDAKRAAVLELIGAREPGVVAMAFDDREDIVAMYRQLGIHAEVLRIHDLSATEPPARGEGEEGMPVAPPTRGEEPASAFPHWPFVHLTIDAESFNDPERVRSWTEEKVCKAFHVPTRPQHADDYLRSAADTFRSRNAEYGATYRTFGPVLAALFPEGLTLKTPEEWQRLAVLVMAAGKMHRFSSAFTRGGHADSALDLSVYAAMLREFTK